MVSSHPFTETQLSGDSSHRPASAAPDLKVPSSNFTPPETPSHPRAHSQPPTCPWMEQNFKEIVDLRPINLTGLKVSNPEIQEYPTTPNSAKKEVEDGHHHGREETDDNIPLARLRTWQAAPLDMRAGFDRVKVKFENHKSKIAGASLNSDERNDLANVPIQKKLSLTSLQRVISTGSLQALDVAIKAALDLLNLLQRPLGEMEGKEPSKWVNSIHNLQQQVSGTRVLVGVVGQTGAGKSSLINALLDESRLVPTNGMRACTAVVTEISYNEADDSSYRFQVDFKTREEWGQELEHGYDDLLDSKGEISSTFNKEDTEAGVAFAKLRAVYPHLIDRKEAVKQYRPQTLLEHESISNLLGTTKTFATVDPKAFYEQLQTYLDCQNKHNSRKGQAKQVGLWPLIKVVRLYVRADVLSTGIVLVDLPGGQDADAARGAVADKYMARCNALWIVSPIQRAIDEKAAKTLLGKTFRLQMKMDGIYSNVTFICSKTDDISVTEVAEGLSIDLGPLDNQKKQAEDELLQEQTHLKRIEIDHKEFAFCQREMKKDLKKWNQLLKSVLRGKTIPMSSAPSRKRKRAFEKDISRSEGKAGDEDDEDSGYENEDDDDDSDMTKEFIQGRIDDLTVDMDRQLVSTKEANDLREKVLQNIEELKTMQKTIATVRISTCIQQRNEYSKNAIRQDFASGIKEIDDDNAANENEDGFDPEEDCRDYDEISQSLPVFCVSSRAYQQALDRTGSQSGSDTILDGFQNLEETEIPQLRQHAKNMTASGQQMRGQKFLSEFGQLLGSLMLWASDNGMRDGVQEQMGPKAQLGEIAHLENVLVKSRKNIGFATKHRIKTLENIVDHKIANSLPIAVYAASVAALTTSAKWGAAKSEGGLSFGTYRAVCRHRGERSTGRITCNFNEELLLPFQEKIASGWGDAFSRDIPRSLDDYAHLTGKILFDLHRDMVNRPALQRFKNGSLAVLRQQVDAHVRNIKSLTDTFKETLCTQQRDVNRIFATHVKIGMSKVYGLCAKEHGKGCFGRMKLTMQAFLNRHKTSLFQSASDKAEKDVRKLCQSIDPELKEKIIRIIDSMGVDYRMLISGGELFEATDVARDEIYELLGSVDARFEKILLEQESMDFNPKLEVEIKEHADVPEHEDDSSMFVDERTVKEEP